MGKHLIILLFLSLPLINQAQEHSESECFHLELSLAHHYLELTYLMEKNELDESSMYLKRISSKELFGEFYRLLTLTQAVHPYHHLEEDFYDKAIFVANRQQNLSASTYLIEQKNSMQISKYGEDYLTKHCHCGKCTRHE